MEKKAAWCIIVTTKLKTETGMYRETHHVETSCLVSISELLIDHITQKSLNVIFGLDKLERKKKLWIYENKTEQ